MTSCHPRTPLLEIRALGCRRGLRRLFAGLTLQVPAGALVEVSGANGSGKTSLLRILAGLAVPECGQLAWAGLTLDEDRLAWRSRIAWLGHAPAVRDDLDAAENLAFACALAGDPPGPALQQAALVQLGIANRPGVPARLLSAGQRRRVALARLAVCDRPLWILDEPFSALDSTATRVLARLIERRLANGGIVVLTTHQAVDIAAPARVGLDLDRLAGISTAGAA